jgi:hypothetical protein
MRAGFRDLHMFGSEFVFVVGPLLTPLILLFWVRAPDNWCGPLQAQHTASALVRRARPSPHFFFSPLPLHITIPRLNLVLRRADYDPFDDGGFCRSRFWLFLSYVVSFASLVGAVWVLTQHYGARPRPRAHMRRIMGMPRALLIAAAKAPRPRSTTPDFSFAGSLLPHI